LGGLAPFAAAKGQDGEHDKGRRQGAVQQRISSDCGQAMPRISVHRRERVLIDLGHGEFLFANGELEPPPLACGAP
jgi:hypothetical protein